MGIQFLNSHHQEYQTPRVHDINHKIEIAKAALKHIPGSESVIQKSFETLRPPIPRDIKPSSPKNLVMHTGFDRNI